MPTLTHSSSPPTGGLLQRDLFLLVLKTAMQLKEIRFARQAALAWLAAFPGDLPVNKLYAEILLEEGHAEQALPVLNQICQADPEYREAVEVKLQAEQKVKARLPMMKGRLTRIHRELSFNSATDTKGWLLALGGSPFPQAKDGRLAEARETTIAIWSRHLKQARQELERGDPEQAENFLHQALVSDPATPLVAATHMKLLVQDKALPLQSRRSLAEHYSQKWPDCIHCQLVLADALMDCGEDEKAVALLHQAVAADTTGQVAERLWGKKHPYRSLWRAPLEIRLEVPIPAGVAAVMGWNQLTSGYTQESTEKRAQAPTGRPNLHVPSKHVTTSSGSDDQLLPWETAVSPTATSKSGSEAASPEEAAELPARPAPPPAEPTLPESLLSVKAELDKMSARLNRPGISRTDGRFPVYVILTCKSELLKIYGEAGFVELEAEMLRLASAVRARRRWDALLFYADEGRTTAAGSSQEITVKAARPNDPWSIKLALVDLDAALAQRGEMIGAVLIVGGPEVVPFHHLPNPVDDADIDVPSDNPYGTRDENYFIPEWPVGRLPGGDPKAGIATQGASTWEVLTQCGSPDFLVCTLRNLTARQEQLSRRSNWSQRFLNRMWLWLCRSLTFGKKGRPSFGYTAAIWKNASLTVFRPIGESQAMFVSPPFQAKTAICPTSNSNGASSEGNEGETASREARKGKIKVRPLVLPDARLGYFNLHGLEDAVEWYGQRDPADPNDGPDYPVALKPEDIPNSGKAPQVVFSEACYGAHILGRSVEEAMALNFLHSGTQGVVGCTSTAYGSIQSPLIAADFLGHAFWNYLQDGAPAGEALRRAKIALAREMHNRQGYLDGEDQKTLISFVLYGDPLAQPVVTGKGPKTIIRPVKPLLMVKTVCDRASETESAQPLPTETLLYVKKIVEQYLPGMEDASLTWSHEHTECQDPTHECPTAQLAKSSGAAWDNPGKPRPGRKVITLSKHRRIANGTAGGRLHRHYARLTLDEKGKLVKLVVSR